MPEIIITDDNWTEHVDPNAVGAHSGYGLIPRDYERIPVGSIPGVRGFDIPLIPESEWQGRLDEQIRNKAQLSDIRNRGMFGQPIPALHQNGQGYCLAYSTGAACRLVRAINNQPFVDLSPHAVACKIKNFRDQGYWGSASLEFIIEHGIPSSEFWPQASMNRAHDNPRTWENAKLHRITEWLDLQPRNKAQLVTCLLMNIPVVTDLNWWRHSVVTMDLVSLNPFRTRILNSHGANYGDNGTAILEGSRAIPDGQVCPRVMTAVAA